MSFKVNLQSSEKKKMGKDAHKLLRTGSIIHLPYDSELWIMDNAELVHCSERNSFAVKKGEVIVLTTNMDLIYFYEGSEFFNARFEMEPNSRIIKSHDCYGLQIFAM